MGGSGGSGRGGVPFDSRRYQSSRDVPPGFLGVEFWGSPDRPWNNARVCIDDDGFEGCDPALVHELYRPGPDSHESGVKDTERGGHQKIFRIQLFGIVVRNTHVCGKTTSIVQKSRGPGLRDFVMEHSSP